MLSTYRKIYDLLDRRERRNAILLFIMMLVTGLLEATGVASIMPFIAVVSNPGVIQTNRLMAAVYSSFGISDEQSFLLFLGTGVFILVVSSLALKALTLWAIARFTHMRGYTLSCRLLKVYLNHPYPWFLNQHSADLGKSVLSEVNQVVGASIMPALQFLAQSIVALFLITLVVAVAPVVALTTIVVLGGAYLMIYSSLRRYLSRIGADRVLSNSQRFQVAQEALGGIKDVKVLGLEDGYIHVFSKPAARFARRQASNHIIGALPHYLLQGIAFGGILSILLILLAARGGDITKVLPLMAFYTFAGLRLLPAMQSVYSTLTKIRFGKVALDALHNDLNDTCEKDLKTEETVNNTSPDPIRLENRLELHDVSYTYPEAKTPALNKLTLTIKARTTVALVGSTGAGKTTAVDLILGLLEPQMGELRVDDKRISHQDVRAWQCNVGYVPQHIFLSDDTVAANIAFGQAENEIDMDAVVRAAKIAELHHFVSEALPEGYQTKVGERGVRISGGQRQRIGIARALYHDPDVLILDEATSALDNVTEKAVMESVHNLGHRKTIILIAHRLTTVENCDEIHMMEHGRIRASGSYQVLLRDDRRFQEMVNSTSSPVLDTVT